MPRLAFIGSVYCAAVCDETDTLLWPWERGGEGQSCRCWSRKREALEVTGGLPDYISMNLRAELMLVRLSKPLGSSVLAISEDIIRETERTAGDTAGGRTSTWIPSLPPIRMHWPESLIRRT